jgi:hypothetical protein
MTSVRKEWSSEPLRVTVVARAAFASQLELKDIAARELLRKNRLLYDACVRPPRPRANARPASLARPSISLVRTLRLSRANARPLAVPRPDSRRHPAPNARPPPASRDGIGVSVFRFLPRAVSRAISREPRSWVVQISLSLRPKEAQRWGWGAEGCVPPTRRLDNRARALTLAVSYLPPCTPHAPLREGTIGSATRSRTSPRPRLAVAAAPTRSCRRCRPRYNLV